MPGYGGGDDGDGRGLLRQRDGRLRGERARHGHPRHRRGGDLVSENGMNAYVQSSTVTAKTFCLMSSILWRQSHAVPSTLVGEVSAEESSGELLII